MQELRLVAVSEDGSYAILAVPGRSGRFLLPHRRPAEDGGQGSVLTARSVRDRSGESVATQGDPGPHPGWRDRRRDRRRRRYPAGPDPPVRGSDPRRAPVSGGTSAAGHDPRAQRLRRPRAKARRHRLGAADAGRSQSGQRRVGFTEAARRELAGPVAVQPRQPDWLRGVDLRLAAAARHPGRRPGRSAVPAAGGLERCAVRRARPAAGHGHLDQRAALRARRGRPRAGAGRRARDSDQGDQCREPAAAGRPARLSARPTRRRPSPPRFRRWPRRKRRPVARASAEPESAQPARKAASGRGRRSSVPSWDEIMFGTSRQSD